MARKTFDVQEFKNHVNTILDPVRCPMLTEGDRLMAASLLAHVLIETDNYGGFKFLDVEYVTDDDGMIVESIVPDESARRYY